MATPGITITTAVACGKNESELGLGTVYLLPAWNEKKAGNPTYRG
jgi:hypothetical protein